MTKVQVWRGPGGMFHDKCFEEGETRDGFTPVKLDEIEDDDECESCGGVFLSGLEPAVAEEEEEDDDDDEDG